MTQKFRNYSFTLNNYSQEEYDELLSLDCKYVIIGKEVCPTTGTNHLQGFIIFKSQRYPNSVRQLNPRAHWEVCQGTPEQNIIYCSKGAGVKNPDGTYDNHGLNADVQERGTKPIGRHQLLGMLRGMLELLELANTDESEIDIKDVIIYVLTKFIHLSSEMEVLDADIILDAMSYCIHPGKWQGFIEHIANITDDWSDTDDTVIFPPPTPQTDYDTDTDML